jgi:hypothetical protein
MQAADSTMRLIAVNQLDGQPIMRPGIFHSIHSHLTVRIQQMAYATNNSKKI